MAKPRKKRMRLPNGIGSVHHINDGKRRRKPWRARVPSHVEFNEDTGKATQKYITIGYYETETAAIEALFDYRKNPYTLEASVATFAEVFEQWKAKKFPDISLSGQKLYTTQFKNSLPLQEMKMRDIRSSHLDNIMQNIKGGYQTQAALKVFWGQMFKYAIEHDICQKNYSDFVKTRDKMPETTRTAIPPEDIAKFWKAADEGDHTAEMVIIYIYTGFRLNELLEIKQANVNLETRIMIGGKKTKAGKDRHVPIHKAIMPLIEKRLTGKSEWLFVMPEKSKKPGQKMSGSAFNDHLAILLKKLNLQGYTAHYTRHTCATMMRQADIKEDIRKLILGHSSQDITDRYTPITDAMLVEAIDTLPRRE